MVAVRPVRLPDDRAPILALDRSFAPDRSYRIVRTPRSLAIEESPVRPPVREDFPLEADLGAGRVWEQGLVAGRAGLVVGFAALAHRQWNRRTAPRHLAGRGQDVGRAFAEAALAAARAAGRRCVWRETSTPA